MSNMKAAWIRGLAAAAVGSCGVLAPAESRSADPVLTAEQHYQLALESQSARNYAAMLVELRFAAEQGHLQAQETLGTVFLTGSTIYGPAIRADRCEAYKWFLAAAQGGSEFGRINVEYLNRVRSAPRGRVACEGAGG